MEDNIALAFTQARQAQLGTDLTGITTIPEALAAAGLDWGVKAIAADNLTVFTEDGMINTRIPGSRLIMRDDNHLTLGVVGARYRSASNAEVFSLGTEIIRQGGKVVRGGEFDGGRKTFLRFELPEAEVLVGGKDLVRFGFDITTTHDGNGKISASLWALRQVCTNGMTARIKDANHEVAIRHTSSAAARLSEANNIIRLASRYAKEFAALAETMISEPFTRGEFTQYIDQLYPNPGEEGRKQTIWVNRRRALLELFTQAETNEEGRGTTWAAYNAITEYLDWAAPIRGAQDDAAANALRARRQFEGTNQSVKDEAFALLTA